MITKTKSSDQRKVILPNIGNPADLIGRVAVVGKNQIHIAELRGGPGAEIASPDFNSPDDPNDPRPSLAWEENESTAFDLVLYSHDIDSGDGYEAIVSFLK